ncbi:Lipase (class 3) [compost metagenome]
MKKVFILGLLLCIKFCAFSQKDYYLSEINPNNFKQDFSSYDQATALFCGQLSDLAYEKKSDIEKWTQSLNALYPESKIKTEFIEFRKTNVQALLFVTKDFMIIAFRGTEPKVLTDWVTDAKYWKYKTTPTYNEDFANMPSGHGGFRKSLIDLIKHGKLFSKIDSMISITGFKGAKGTFPVYTTGHSLGAAISQLFMECLRYKGYNFQGAYHFAPPLAVSCEWRYHMQEHFANYVHDIVNYKDYVPRAGRNGVAHFGQFYRICLDGKLYREYDAYVKFSVGEYFKAIKYHSLINYLKYLRNDENSAMQVKDRLSNFSCIGESIKERDPCKDKPQ